MVRELRLTLLFVSCCLPGCTAIDSIAVWPNGRFVKVNNEQLARGFNLTDDAEIEEAISQSNKEAIQQFQIELVREDILKTRRGSIVYVKIGLGLCDDFKGTILSASPGRVELTNCVSREIINGPDGQRQCKTSHVPYKSLKTTDITRFYAVSPPTETSLRFDYETSDACVVEVVYKNGRRQHLGKPSERDILEQGTDTAERVQKQIAETPIGSQVGVVDEFKHRINAILLSAGPEGVELMNCIVRETVPGSQGQPLYKTSSIGFQSLKTSSIRSFGIISPPPADFFVPERGVDCDAYIIEGFVDASGCWYRWGMPIDWDPSGKVAHSKEEESPGN